MLKPCGDLEPISVAGMITYNLASFLKLDVRPLLSHTLTDFEGQPCSVQPCGLVQMSWQFSFEHKISWHRNTFIVAHELVSDIIIGESGITKAQVLRLNRDQVRCQTAQEATDVSEVGTEAGQSRATKEVSINLGFVSGTFRWHGRRIPSKPKNE